MPLEGDKYGGSDLNILYGNVINANNELLEMENALTTNETPNRLTYLNLIKKLQQAVDELIDVSIVADTMKYNSISLKSLTDILTGKVGRFRQTLLGRRVDYSGRSVIVPGPKLRL